VAALYAVRNADRQTELFEHSLLPLAEQALANARQSYTTGTGTFIDLIESQRTLLDVRLLIVQARIDREKRLAEMEALAGVDIETLGAAPTTSPTAPTTIPSGIPQ
jgi:outer membrane protein TolC